MISRNEEIVAAVSPRSIGGVSLFETAAPITSENVREFYSEESVINNTCNELRRRGFRVLQVSPTTISIAGSRQLFQEVFGTELHKEKVTTMEDTEVEFYAPPGEPAEQLLQPSEDLSNLIEGVALAVPPVYFGEPSPLPPIALPEPNTYRYLFVPDEVALLLRAARVHRLGTTGKDIKVAMPDTGFYRHPFYNWHGYRVEATVLGPGASNPEDDSYGHGTGEAANIFATAPDVTLIPVKMGDDPTGAFNTAVSAKPNIITCSWGLTWPPDQAPYTITPYAQTLAAAIANAVAQNIVVCFSAGNGTWRGFPAGHPDIISVGGVHVNYPFYDLNNFQASSYASSFNSYFYPGRHVPDICGLVGKNVNGTAPLIMLPVQPGCTLDYPNTGATNDAWSIFSGTSAASPQVAGVVALMLQKQPTLTPAQVKSKLMSTATDVKVGQSAMGDSAGPGTDAATGAGLVDAKWAWIVAMGDVLGEFIESPPEKQAIMLANGQVPRSAKDLIPDVIRTLRSR